jgi:uncharacterized membrane protein
MMNTTVKADESHMKAILCSIIVLTGLVLMMMSTATLTGFDKAKKHRVKPEAKERLISVPTRFVADKGIT